MFLGLCIFSPTIRITLPLATFEDYRKYVNQSIIEPHNFVETIESNLLNYYCVAVVGVVLVIVILDLFCGNCFVGLVKVKAIFCPGAFSIAVIGLLSIFVGVVSFVVYHFSEDALSLTVAVISAGGVLTLVGLTAMCCCGCRCLECCANCCYRCDCGGGGKCPPCCCFCCQGCICCQSVCCLSLYFVLLVLFGLGFCVAGGYALVLSFTGQVGNEADVLEWCIGRNGAGARTAGLRHMCQTVQHNLLGDCVLENGGDGNSNSGVAVDPEEEEGGDEEREERMEIKKKKM